MLRGHLRRPRARLALREAVRVRAAGEQQLRDGRVAGAGRLRERGAVVLVGLVDPHLLSRSNSEDPADIDRKLVLCVQLLSCVYICSVPVQQCVHLRSTASQQLCVHYMYLPNIVKMCVHLLSTAVCTFAQVYTAVYTVA